MRIRVGITLLAALFITAWIGNIPGWPSMIAQAYDEDYSPLFEFRQNQAAEGLGILPQGTAMGGWNYGSIPVDGLNAAAVFPGNANGICPDGYCTVWQCTSWPCQTWGSTCIDTCFAQTCNGPTCCDTCQQTCTSTSHSTCQTCSGQTCCNTCQTCTSHPTCQTCNGPTCCNTCQQTCTSTSHSTCQTYSGQTCCNTCQTCTDYNTYCPPVGRTGYATC